MVPKFFANRQSTTFVAQLNNECFFVKHDWSETQTYIFVYMYVYISDLTKKCGCLQHHNPQGDEQRRRLFSIFSVHRDISSFTQLYAVAASAGSHLHQFTVVWGLSMLMRSSLLRKLTDRVAKLPSLAPFGFRLFPKILQFTQSPCMCSHHHTPLV